jgi:hypothetical protein
MSYYNRYNEFLLNGDNKTVPLIDIPTRTSDRYIVYKVGKSRLDKLSQQMYDTPYFGWLILQANPGYGTQEWDIPDGSIMRVPFPLFVALQDYKDALDRHFLYYGR